MNEEDQIEELEQVIAPDIDLSEFNDALTASMPAAQGVGGPSTTGDKRPPMAGAPVVPPQPQFGDDTYLAPWRNGMPPLPGNANVKPPLRDPMTPQGQPGVMTFPPAKPGQKALDPAVYNYLFKLSADRQGDQAQLARQASRDVRAQATLAGAGGIARGLAQTGTLFGKAPDVTPYTDTLKGLSAAQEDFAKRQHANKLVGMGQQSAIDKRVLDYLLPQTAKGGAGAAKGAWKEIVNDKGERVWQYLQPGQIAAAPSTAAQSKWLLTVFPDDHPKARQPAYGRMKPDGTWEYTERDPGTRQITTVGPDGNPRIQIVPNVPTTSGPPGARRAAPAAPVMPGATTPPTKLPPTTKVPQPSSKDTWPELGKEDKDREPQPAETPQPEEGYPAARKPEALAEVEIMENGKRVKKFVPKREGDKYEVPSSEGAMKESTTLASHHNNFISLMNDVKQIWKDYGKTGVFLTHPEQGTILQGKLDEMANDYAKISDPMSVNRPSEIEAAKRILNPLMNPLNVIRLNADDINKVLDSLHRDMIRKSQFQVIEARKRGITFDMPELPTHLRRPGETGYFAIPEGGVGGPKESLRFKVGEEKTKDGEKYRWDGKRWMPAD